MFSTGIYLLLQIKRRLQAKRVSDKVSECSTLRSVPRLDAQTFRSTDRCSFDGFDVQMALQCSRKRAYP